MHVAFAATSFRSSGSFFRHCRYSGSRESLMSKPNPSASVRPRGRAATISSTAQPPSAWTSAGAIALALLLCGSAGAQEFPGFPGAASKEAVQAPEPSTPEAVESRRVQVASELRLADAALREANPSQGEHVLARREQLLRIAKLLDDHAAFLSRPAFAPDEIPLPTVDAPSPLALNALYEAWNATTQRANEREALLEAARDALAAAKHGLDEADRQRRRARAQLAEAEAGETLEAQRTLELRELASRAAQEEVYLRRTEVRALQQAEDGGAGAELERQIEVMRDALESGKGTPAAGSNPLIEREGRLVRRRKAFERRLETVEFALEATQGRYLKRADPSAELLAEVEALTAQRDLLREHAALTEGRLARQAQQREIWSYWDALVRGQAPRAELAAWESTTERQLATLAEEEREIATRVSELERSVGRVEGELSSAPEGSTLHQTLSEQLETVSRVLDEQRTDGTAASADRRVAERVLANIHDQAELLGWREAAAEVVGTARDVWNYEITTVDDASITIGSVVLAILLFTIGLWAARRGSSLVAHATRRRFELDPGAANALQTLSFYALLVSFTLLALRAVHFPLTAFTVLGGALAIGVGFGSQNVMNNFISGLILMLERPVRAHDVVEVDGNHGTIEKIGARSTQIRSVDGRHIIVPNSFFLESNVVNWTLSDDLIRTKVSVGVIYGSPTRLVEQLMRRVIEEDEQILRSPGPAVVFEEFGDNALNFDIYFWVKARSPMEVRIVQSRVRFHIDELFREHELVIAFPQRDVHLDSAIPLEVRVLTHDDAPKSKTTRNAT